MGQGPDALLLAATTTARHGHHGTFWTGPRFSWLGDKDFESIRSCIHHLVIWNIRREKTNSSSRMQLTHWLRQSHSLLSHASEAHRFTSVSKASFDCFLVLHSKQLKRQNWIRTAISYLRGYSLNKCVLNEQATLFIICKFSWAAKNCFKLERGTLMWPQMSLSNLLTNLLVQVYSIKNTNPLSHSLFLKVPITSHDHYFTNRAVNWWHHEANIIKHRCHTNPSEF